MTRFRSILFCAALLLAVPASAQKAEVTRSKAVGKATATESATEYSDRYTGRYALLLGNVDYSGSGYVSLPGVRTDIARMDSALWMAGFDDVVVDTNLTREDMDYAIDDFITMYGLDPNNGLLIYYAGHGESPNLGKPSLVPVNTQAEPVRRDFEEDRGYRRAHRSWLKSMMTVQDFYDLSSDAYAKHVLYILDGCYSGSLLKMEGNSTEYSGAIRDLMTNPSRYVITSGPWDRKVPDESLFTATLFNALTHPDVGSGDSFWTGRSLGMEIVREVSEQQGDRRNKLVPQHGPMPSWERGDFVIPISAFALSRDLVESVIKTVQTACAPAIGEPDPFIAFGTLTAAHRLLTSGIDTPDIGTYDEAIAWKAWQDTCLDPLATDEWPNSIKGRLSGLAPPAAIRSVLAGPTS